MESNFNYLDTDYLNDEENWRELPEQLPFLEFTAENILQSEDYDLTYRSIRDPHSFSETTVSVDLSSNTDFHSNFKGGPGDLFLQPNHPIGKKNHPRENLLELKAPVVPFYLGCSQFSLKMSLSELVQNVENCLDRIVELDYGFVDSSCKVQSICPPLGPSSHYRLLSPQWDIIYLRGSSYCHFEISLFDERMGTENYVLEGNRLSVWTLLPLLDSWTSGRQFILSLDFQSNQRGFDVIQISPVLTHLPLSSVSPSTFDPFQACIALAQSPT
jgi:hypothetical protein